MRRDLFHYDLPTELIASHPPSDRESARLLVVRDQDCAHHTIRDLPDLLPANALIVVNDTRVIRARLLGQKASSGGKVEIFLVRRLGLDTIEQDGRTYDAERWQAMGKSSKPLRPGMLVTFDPDRSLVVRIGDRAADGILDVWLFSMTNTAIADAVDALGHVPLPPYMHRDDEQQDRSRYQTVYAREPGAVAAPTAGLHLTNELLERMRARGIEIAQVTLHVGLGTFQPVAVDDLDDHPMHTESFSVSEQTRDAIERARGRGADVVAIGTTSVRALESAADLQRPGFVRAMQGDTKLLIQPGYRFRVVDRLLTNFHLPESTLLALVSAFSGLDRIRNAYREAIAERYRFFSYGDAMLLRRSE